MAEKSKLSRVHHIGAVVKDMDKAIELLTSLGLGPFKPLNRAPLIEKKHKGKVSDWRLKIMMGKAGGVELELLQPLEGDSPQKEFLDKTGGGISHLGFMVDDLDKEAEQFIKKGARVTSSGKRATGGGYHYLEFDALPGIIIELAKD